MTNEEQDIKWPLIPPYDCDRIHLFKRDGRRTDGSVRKGGIKRIGMKVTQDTIDDIIAYFEAARESMNE